MSTTTDQSGDHHQRRRRRRRSTTALVAVACAGAAALSVQHRALAPSPRRRRMGADGGGGPVPLPRVIPHNGDGVLAGLLLAAPPRAGGGYDAASSAVVGDDGDGDDEDEAAAADRDDPAVVTHSRLIDSGAPLPPYAIDDAVLTSRMYDNTYSLLVYDPERDVFLALHSRRHNWVSGCNKLLTSFRILTYLLRRTFPERFRGAESDELGECRR
jgi:hypothetical protein